MKMRRIVVIEEHPHGNSEKVGDGWQTRLPDNCGASLSLTLERAYAGKRVRQFGKVDIPRGERSSRR
jgi:hypothetical protein